jgi:hypothetical protein
MWMCILATDANVSAAREKTKEISPDLLEFKQPCSPTGQLPVTHWICMLKPSDDLRQKILAANLDVAEVLEITPSDLFKDRQLKRIDTTKQN